jgi:ATP-dependent Zn protease
MDGIISFKLFFVIFFCLNVIVECKGFGYGINYFKFSNEDNESFIYNVSFINFDKFKTLPFYYEKQVLNATSFFLQNNKTINSALFINNINDLKQLSNSKIPLIGIIMLKFIENTEKSNKYLNNSLVKYFIINDTKKEVQDFILTNVYNKKVQINFNRSDKNYLVFIIIPLISIILQIFIIVLFSKMKKIYRNNGILKIHKFISFCPIFIFLLILTLISQIISTIKNNLTY